MSGVNLIQPRRRITVRRTEDLLLRKQIDRHIKLFHIGQLITSEINCDTLFEVIADQTNQIMDSERCSVFLVDEKGSDLEAFVSTDLKKNEIKIHCNQGVAGWVYSNKLPLIVPDAYTDKHFFPGVDHRTGFKTKNILCVPLVNRKNECIGTLQALNKKSGDFSEDDREVLSYLSNYVTVAIENAKLYEELKAADKAKERVINHLSHELRTPLSIISTAFAIIEQKAQQFDNTGIKKAAQRGRRSVARLMDLQEKVDDIIKQRPVEEKMRIMSFIEDTVNILEELEGDGKGRCEQVLGLAKNRLESIFAFEEHQIERIQIDEVVNDILREELPSNRRDYPVIISKIRKGLFIFIDRNVLKKVLEGLLKNAIENTPNGGRIEISATAIDNIIRIEFRDFGVGITSENQKNIFGGFFHTRDTDFYTSKNPYEFSAGGAGLELMRIKAFSEIFGFSVGLESRRCKFIPLDSDLCEGKITKCPFIKEKADCLSSGGSTFWIKFEEANQAASSIAG